MLHEIEKKSYHSENVINILYRREPEDVRNLSSQTQDVIVMEDD